MSSCRKPLIQSCPFHFEYVRISIVSDPIQNPTCPLTTPISNFQFPADTRCVRLQSSLSATPFHNHCTLFANVYLCPSRRNSGLGVSLNHAQPYSSGWHPEHR